VREPPEYFETIRAEAAARWEQLEADTELAGPWRQLFRQVKSPRHCLSELLQNADDAGATWARVAIEGDALLFEHNGHDFLADEFRSLCNFGHSNKRSLLTIGFRGMGFRSLFSLGKAVEVHTPSLAIRFDEARFTEPVWLEAAVPCPTTQIRIPRCQNDPLGAVATEIARWRDSPLPLLLFQNVRRLDLDGVEVAAVERRPGPVAESEWVRLTGGHEAEVLVLQSAEAPFPEPCAAEVREEHNDTDVALPPCRVTLLLAPEGNGRLHVVLPTDIRTGLPVSFHAPFVQDPARRGIKDLTTSATNRWLLERIGHHLACSLSAWLHNRDLSLADRAAAYRLLPELEDDVEDEADEVRGRIVAAFQEEVEARRILLCSDGVVRGWEVEEEAEAPADVVALPREIHWAWEEAEVRRLFEYDSEPLLAPEVSREAVTRLDAWYPGVSPEANWLIEQLTAASEPARPDLGRLLLLHGWIEAAQRTKYGYLDGEWSGLPLLPAQDRDHLFPAAALFLHLKRPEGCDEPSWDFLTKGVGVLDAAWSQILERAADTPAEVAAEMAAAVGEPVAEEDVALGRTFAEKIVVPQRVQTATLLRYRSDAIFAQETPPHGEAVQLARVAAVLGERAKEMWRYLCRDGRWRRRDQADGVLRDDPYVEGLLPDGYTGRLLADAYTEGLDAVALHRWEAWVADPNQGSIPAVPLPGGEWRLVEGGDVPTRRNNLRAWCRARRSAPPQESRRWSTFNVYLYDADWPSELWDQWETLAEQDPLVWSRLTRALVDGWNEDWERVADVAFRQLPQGWDSPEEAGVSLSHAEGDEPVVAAWSHHLRDRACLPDKYDHLHRPEELLRSTRETAPFHGVEPFVHPDWDREGAETFLDRLGVRSAPEDYVAVLGHLRALSQVEEPPLDELVQRYRALEVVFPRLAGDKQNALRKTFGDDPLLLSGAGWRRAEEVFQENPDEVPGVVYLDRALQGLRPLWDALGVRLRPSKEDGLAWLRSQADRSLDRNGRERVQGVLKRYPVEAWREVGLWLAMGGRLRRVADFVWSKRQGDDVPPLLSNWRGRVADLSFVDATLMEESGLTLPPPLAAHMSIHVIDAPEAEDVAAAEHTRALQHLGRLLMRLQGAEADDVVAVEHDRCLGERLRSTTWQRCRTLRVRYSAGEGPITQVERAEVAWVGERLFVAAGKPLPYNEVVAELRRAIHTRLAKETVTACLLRPSEFIDTYAASTPGFALAPEEGAGDRPQDAGTAPAATVVAEASPGSDEEPVAADGGVMRKPGEADGDGRRRSRRHRIDEQLRRLGLEKGDDGVFQDAEGRALRRNTREDLFPWSWEAGGRTVPAFLWRTGGDGDRPVEIPAEVWDAGCDSEAVLLILGTATLEAIPFCNLHRKIEDEGADLFVATYRLVFRHTLR